jgi:hypothetical protein
VLVSLGLSRLAFIPVWLFFDPSQFAQGLMISMWAFTITPLVTIFWALMFLDLADRVTSKDPG